MTGALTRSLPLALIALMLLAPSAMAARGFSLGVAAGEVIARSAVLWGKAKKSGEYRLAIATNRRFQGDVDSHLVRARKANDNTVQRRVSGLEPGERYWYHFVGSGGRRSDLGTFVTAPRPSQNATIEFAFTGDTDFSAAPGQSHPFWNSGGVFRRMKAEGNDFNIHFGDTIYSDSEVRGRLRPIALGVRQKWAKYRTNLRNPNLRRLRNSAGLYSHWDDHEFVNDFSPAENSFDHGVNINGRKLYRRGVNAFTDYAPVSWSKRDGLYRTVRWGKNLELFFLDERSFRSAKADEGGVCDNPETGEPDLAPTAPKDTRNLFSGLVPSFKQPVAQACLDAIASPERTFLGRRQLRRFMRAIEESDARFKVIMNELSIQQFYALPYDSWAGYTAERDKLLRGLWDVKNVVFLTTDVHATLVNDARLLTLEPGGPVNSGIMEVTVGPAASRNFALEIDRETETDGAGALIDAGFFTPQPLSGVGMQCSVIDQFSYAQVKATNRRLTITPKDIGGRRLVDGDQPCGPFALDFQP
jgi:phosphodiesterase/alkaline phosphatase D-like protein